MYAHDEFEPDHSTSSTGHVIEELELYGYRPPEGEADPRITPEDTAIQGAVADIFDALISTMADTSLDFDLDEIMWSTVNTFHRAVERIERKLDDNEQAQKRLQREQDGSEVKSVQLETLIGLGQNLIERRDMAVTVSHAGYIKRVPLSTYRAQRRGGKGRSGMAMRDEDFVTRIFIANTHTPVLFFSSRGMVYKLKVWRLPEAAPQARGKALVNLLPLQPGEHITTVMPMPEDEDSWDSLDVMFATSKGTVRRNKLSDFVGIRQNGKIAMKLDEGMELLNVATCTDMDDVLLTTAKGMCIRFPVTQVRVFSGRDSTGVRGITLGNDDAPIGMTILRHFEAASEERGAYLKLSRLMRGEADDSGSEEEIAAGELSQERYAEMGAAEQFVLTVSENGYGKRTSSHEYRVTGRGGKGITAIATNERNGDVVASFPVEDGDQIMLVTNGGQLIRCPVSDIRIAGRATQGVTIFDTAEGEHVVSVEHIPEESEDEDAEAEEPDAGGNNKEDGSNEHGE